MLTRTIRVVDTTPPVVTLVGSGDITLEIFTPFVDEGADWSDNYDGTGHIKATSGKVNINAVGVYVLEYQYRDQNGNTGNVVTRTVTIQDSRPVIMLNGVAEMQIDLGTTYVSPGATRECPTDGTGVVMMINGIVDTSKAGIYTTEYSHVNSLGFTGSAFRTVKVINKLAIG